MEQRVLIWFSKQSSGLGVRKSRFLFLTLPLSHFVNRDSLEFHSFLFSICTMEAIVRLPQPLAKQNQPIEKDSVYTQSTISSGRIQFFCELKHHFQLPKSRCYLENPNSNIAYIFCPLNVHGFEIFLTILNATVKLDCSASVYTPFHSLISVFRDDEFWFAFTVFQKNNR